MSDGIQVQVPRARRIPKEVVTDYVVGSLKWSGVELDLRPAAVDRLLGAFTFLAGHGLFHLPFFVVADLFTLLDRGLDAVFTSDGRAGSWSEEDRALRLRYEREVLLRVLQHRAVSELFEALKTSPDREAQLHRLLYLIGSRWAEHVPRRVQLGPAAIRRLYELDISDETVESGAAAFDRWAGPDASPRSVLAAFVDSVGRGLGWSKLIGPEDRFELLSWRSLTTEDLRIGCRQILAVHERLDAFPLPTQIDVREDDEAETSFVDETYYPMGGLAELTHRGSIENLVTSQLAFIEDGPDINVFDLRYVEGELLYYLRDEGALRRKRRTVHWILDLGSSFHLKSRGWDYQFSILVQGLFLRLWNDLQKVFEHDSVLGRFHYLASDAESVGRQSAESSQEMKLLRLLLADEVAHEWVDFQFAGHELELDGLRDPQRKTYAVVASAGRAAQWVERFAAEQDKDQPVHGVVLELSDAESAVGDAQIQVSGMEWDELGDLRRRLIQALVS